ncbi:bis(5'-nucleosyl)-tetraphosphatase (symmetrical) [Solemya pervernicosa gill symbiont]|uniref:Bis(5'-nucleosyl)-tetraphosphatase, symmetrical n=2 Tax=Gammaproteobacteria incertae sedis TaxID=118884 RepID=A0A1T2L148_9GAMM|nr:symmetrical bis(5'-nucleosyl)-tetraphosphatase [Candidatus Reidiella endopervernicosa]OOZ38792.1 bis(5'-nucleosyl)-tetraphosphatase (symmetrical) [Solemya pervernicosa gill symbiont]QKQ25922.1 symmetrical bis(5'-nucleosyl)-tetraphosphatase [Candidatus Reidiella endopervernicosa]
MATYAIGDIQGCFDELQQLLQRINFDPAKDQLWFTGDLVNRGPKSLETVRFVKSLGDRAITVLGNHDLHMLAVAEGHLKYSKNDNFQPLIEADDGPELLRWLRHQPLLHHDAKLGYTMIHAGLAPQWDLSLAQACAAEVEAVLQGDDYVDFLQNMYGNKPKRWKGKLEGIKRLRFITNCFSRMRYLEPDGALEFHHKGAPGSQPEGLIPWFEHPERRSRDLKVIIGHWSTLGLMTDGSLFALDTGCLWGGTLTAYCLESGESIAYNCPGCRSPKE